MGSNDDTARCGAWPQLGGCVLPRAHNMGNADLPDAHEFPPGLRRVAVYLPVVDGTEKFSAETDGERRVCSLCQHDIRADTSGWYVPQGPPPDKVIVSATLGTVHVECYLAELHARPVEWAWRVIALEIARHPSKHTAAEIRAALTALTRMAREK